MAHSIDVGAGLDPALGDLKGRPYRSHFHPSGHPDAIGARRIIRKTERSFIIQFPVSTGRETQELDVTFLL